jgi:hypothetical protein
MRQHILLRRFAEVLRVLAPVLGWCLGLAEVWIFRVREVGLPSRGGAAVHIFPELQMFRLDTDPIVHSAIVSSLIGSGQMSRRVHTGNKGRCWTGGDEKQVQTFDVDWEGTHMSIVLIMFVPAAWTCERLEASHGISWIAQPLQTHHVGSRKDVVAPFGKASLANEDTFRIALAIDLKPSRRRSPSSMQHQCSTHVGVLARSNSCSAERILDASVCWQLHGNLGLKAEPHHACVLTIETIGRSSVNQTVSLRFYSLATIVALLVTSSAVNRRQMEVRSAMRLWGEHDRPG